MLPDQVSNPGPLTYESGALPIALRGPGVSHRNSRKRWVDYWGGGAKGMLAPSQINGGGGLPPPSSYAYAINSLL